VVIALPDLVRVFRRVVLAAGVVVVLLVIGVIGYQVLGEIAPREAQTIETALFDTQNVRSLDDREDIWDDAIQTIKTHPLFGIGPGKSEVYLLHNHAHNLLLQHWIDAGLLGFIGIVCVSLSAFWRSAELIGAAFRAGGPLDEDETIRVLAGVALMFSIVANSMSASLTTAVMTAFVVFVGIAFVNEPLAGEAPEA
jgi:O-antigen ligase